MYYVRTITANSSGVPVEQVVLRLSDDFAISFPNTDLNEGPERAAYLAWLAEGNTPEPWQPEEPAG